MKKIKFCVLKTLCVSLNLNFLGIEKIQKWTNQNALFSLRIACHIIINNRF